MKQLETIINVTNLSKRFETVTALNSVSFSVQAGALFGLIGADGAGKSTLLRILTTLTRQDSGSATLLGLDCVRNRSEIRRRIGYMPQKFSLYEDLTVKENLAFFADIFDLHGAPRTARIERLLEFSRLGPFQNRRAGNLSGGMKQKLALSCALVHTPEIVILDEPTTGVDPVSRNEFWDILRELRNQGVTLIVSTPYMDEAEYCHELVLLHKGAIIRKGSPRALIQEYPKKLYAVTAQASSLRFPASNPLPRGISLVYASGGALHVAAERSCGSGDDILSEMRRQIPEASGIEEIVPGVEDVFFLALAGLTETHNPIPRRKKH